MRSDHVFAPDTVWDSNLRRADALASVVHPVQFRDMSGKTATASIQPRFRVSFARRFDFGPGKAELLELIASTGSIREAAKRMGMSYMRAWTLVKSMDRGLVEPVVRKIRGGNSRGGAELTDTGRQLLQAYRDLEAATCSAIESIEPRFRGLLKTGVRI